MGRNDLYLVREEVAEYQGELREQEEVRKGGAGAGRGKEAAREGTGGKKRLQGRSEVHLF